MDFLSVFRPLRTAARLTGRSIRFGLVRPSSIFPWLWSTMPDSQTPRRPSARPPGRCARRPPRCPCRRACPSRRYRRPRWCSRPRRPLSTDRSSRLVHRVVGGPLVGLGVPMLPADALSCQDDLLCSRLFLKPPPRSGEPPSPWPWRRWFRSPACPLCLLAQTDWFSLNFISGMLLSLPGPQDNTDCAVRPSGLTDQLSLVQVVLPEGLSVHLEPVAGFAPTPRDSRWPTRVPDLSVVELLRTAGDAVRLLPVRARTCQPHSMRAASTTCSPEFHGHTDRSST